MEIIVAKKEQNEVIASFIMEAMNYECCKNLAGPNHSIHDFYLLMCKLVAVGNSQYSFLNTLVAIDDKEQIMGVCVSYDGALLHELREAFIIGAKKQFGIDYSDMKDETQPGELYIDSLCVGKEFRHKGIASALLHATINKAKTMNINKVGLLVDCGNPDAENLYTGIGFTFSNNSSWGGHEMRHLVYDIVNSKE
nr:GNAT family N-acetyltransferase [Prevotella sp.]